MKNEQIAKGKKITADEASYTPIRAFRFVLQVSGLESHRVSYVRSLPGRQLEIGYVIVEDSEPLSIVELGGVVKMLNSRGEVVRSTTFKGTGFEWLPFQFDYKDSGNLIQRLIFTGVEYNP